MIELPFPAKILWPNGRGHHMAKHRAFQAHKQWAWAAARSAKWAAYLQLDPDKSPEPPIQWSVTVYPKTAHPIDDDNARAALKAYQDGIAKAMGVDDKRFAAPSLQFGEPVKGGRVVVSIVP